MLIALKGHELSSQIGVLHPSYIIAFYLYGVSKVALQVNKRSSSNTVQMS
jgi:hypothetical protein